MTHAAPPHHPAAHVQRASPGAAATLNIGDVVTISGQQYTVGATLVPLTGTPAPTPTPAPVGITVSRFTDVNGNALGAVPYGGEKIHALGAGFGTGVGTVTYGGQPCGLLAWSATEVDFYLPATVNAGSPVTITRSDGQSFTGPLTPPAPTPAPLPTGAMAVPVVITGAHQAAGTVIGTLKSGDSLFIDGQGFGTTAGFVTVDGQPAAITSWTDTEVIIASPNAYYPQVGLWVSVIRSDNRWDSAEIIAPVPVPAARHYPATAPP